MSSGFVGFHAAPVVRRDGIDVALVLATAGDYGFTLESLAALKCLVDAGGRRARLTPGSTRQSPPPEPPRPQPIASLPDEGRHSYLERQRSRIKWSAFARIRFGRI
jgi:hypothetical protein